MYKEVISFKLNKEDFSCYTEAGVSLREVLYSHATYSGIPTVGGIPIVDVIAIVNGVVVDCAKYPVARAINREVITAEYLKTDEKFAAIEQDFISVQLSCCTKCITEVIMTCLPLLASPTPPTRHKIASTLQGLICAEADLEKVIIAVTKAYNRGSISLFTPTEEESPVMLEVLDPKFAKKKETPMQISSVESSTISLEPPVLMPVEQPQTPEILEPTQQPTNFYDDGENAVESEPELEPEKEKEPELITPASIFDEGFAESIAQDAKEKSNVAKKTQEKPKSGFFSKFSAAFKDRHHKTLELPNIDHEE